MADPSMDFRPSAKTAMTKSSEGSVLIEECLEVPMIH